MEKERRRLKSKEVDLKEFVRRRVYRFLATLGLATAVGIILYLFLYMFG
ncbi:hypothetical protein [Metabacillus iocasae]|uniref:Peptidoglycan/LPS O-acetylase OafA/YrhL n=1 Tax=Priestia iocasae TaxID=2291674 RepID=A0ABS2QTS6_9BACI|nr:hypothetical protein [Metabacillus iocasae]MBM7702166.1 peptidoglycan/LPS O-acetylase OafA/YrhL [Metabacillus iocasae]